MNSDSDKKKILITGASGLYGANAVIEGKSKYNILGLYNQNLVRIPGANFASIDLTKAKDAHKIINEFKPSAIIHAAAWSNVDGCEENKDLAYKTNVETTQILSNYARDNNIKFVFFSTDAFFEGDKLFTEEDEPQPINYYGETKLLSEIVIKNTCPTNHLIIRTNFYGWNAQNKLSLSEWILSNIAQKMKTPLFFDVKYSPLYVQVLSKAIFNLIDLNITGTFNIAGSESISKLDFGLKLLEEFNLDTNLVAPSLVKSAGLKARRSKAMALSTLKIQSIFPTMDFSIMAGIKAQKADLNNGVVDILKNKKWKFWGLRPEN